jgi:hypothetical protein
VRDALEIHLVSDVREVLGLALSPASAPNLVVTAG